MKELGRVDHYVGLLLSTYIDIPGSVTDFLRQRVEVVQRDGHTQWDSTQVHGVTSGAEEVTETRRSNKPGGAKVPMALLPSGKVGKRRWQGSNAFTNVMDEDVGQDRRRSFGDTTTWTKEIKVTLLG